MCNALVVVIPCPIMYIDIVPTSVFLVLDGRTIGRIISPMLPICRVGTFASTSKPGVRIAKGYHWQYVFFVHFHGLLSGVKVPKLGRCVLGWRWRNVLCEYHRLLVQNHSSEYCSVPAYLSPWHLPTHTIGFLGFMRTDFLSTFWNFAILFQ